jgi:hypothetical protein
MKSNRQCDIYILMFCFVCYVGSVIIHFEMKSLCYYVYHSVWLIFKRCEIEFVNENA